MFSFPSRVFGWRGEKYLVFPQVFASFFFFDNSKATRKREDDDDEKDEDD